MYRCVRFFRSLMGQWRNPLASIRRFGQQEGLRSLVGGRWLIHGLGDRRFSPLDGRRQLRDGRFLCGLIWGDRRLGCRVSRWSHSAIKGKGWSRIIRPDMGR
ncbi:MAG: hypothetical protein ACKOCD_10965 [Nitrospiraceae bacterium]